MTVLSPQLLESFAASVLPTSQASTLPATCYTDEEFFAFEKEAVFGQEWLCLGRESDVPNPGDFVNVEMIGERLTLVRGQDGTVRVLSPVCQHRGMLVSEGRGNCRAFKCAYHHWTYGLDGSLVGAREMDRTEGFDRSQWGLPSLPVETWQGFVFTSLRTNPEPLAPRLAKLDELFAHYELGRCVSRKSFESPSMPWNWKVMFENFNDGYHASRLHAGVHDFCPSNRSSFLPYEPDDASIARTNGFLFPDGGFNALQKALLPIFPGLTEEERSRAAFALVPPTLCLGVAPDQAFYFLIRPKNAGHIEVEVHYLFHPEALRDRLFEEKFQLSEAGVNSIVAQDVMATTGVQRGLTSRFAPRGRYSYLEEAQQQFNQWLVRRYTENWPGGGRGVSSSSMGTSASTSANTPALAPVSNPTDREVAA
ncbi:MULTISPECIES: aromatic ring-hydroxylating dioxygenase subunit alpha [unclassified Pseudofrankia]|uniref:aromatic ring-hydroxylating oxygenase subunit alpha n=1 Tax=unclassified Pseudofrankia TaxID=2994372 RepID=UPI0009F4A3AF|nr:MULTISPECIES: aromatic ring-hydroxylating dioxygenase subunit alpha [unclassified Pseudofrankia]MDT3440095.1 aromatic ring-hydroxylating dioxygenase subunit alpha [Pseudofrankia sp. BMG5.37]